MPTFGLPPVRARHPVAPRQFVAIRPALRPIAGLYPAAAGGQIVDTQGQEVVRLGGMPHSVRASEFGRAIYTGASTSAGQFGISHVDTVSPLKDGVTVVGVMRRMANVQQTFTALHPTSTSPLSSDYLEVGKPAGGTNVRFRSRRSGASLALTLTDVEPQFAWFNFVGVFESGSIRGYLKCPTKQPGVVFSEVTGTAGVQTAMPRASFGGWNFRADNANLYQPTAGGDIILMQWLNVALLHGEAMALCDDPFNFLFEPAFNSVPVIDKTFIGAVTGLQSEPSLSPIIGGQNYLNAGVSGTASSSTLSTVIGSQNYFGAVQDVSSAAEASTTEGKQAFAGQASDLSNLAQTSTITTAFQNYVSSDVLDVDQPSQLSQPIGTANLVGTVSDAQSVTSISSITGEVHYAGAVDPDFAVETALSTVVINEVIIGPVAQVSAHTAVPSSRLKDIPVLDPSGKNAKQFADRMREVVQTFQGNRGDKLDRAMTFREAMKLGLIDGRGRFTGIPPGGSDGIKDIIKDIVDSLPEPPMDTPPTPDGLVVTAGISHIYIKHSQPAYYGHYGTVVYAAKWPRTQPVAPTFGDAVEMGNFQGNIGAIPSDPATRWCVWIKWINKKGVLSIEPAGGTNGAQVTTGQDVGLLLDAISAAAQDLNSPYSKVFFRADMFYIGPAYDYQQNTAPGLPIDIGKLWKNTSTGEVFTWSGSSWEPFTLRLPFIVQTRPTEINGMYIPAGVYMDSAFIYDLTASIARLGDAWIDNAMIANLSAGKIIGGAMQVGSYIESADFSNPSNQALPEQFRTGWRINADGTAQMYEMTLRGAIYARYGQIGGARIGTTFVQSTNWLLGVSGWTLDNETGTLAAATCQIAKNIAPGQEANARVFNTEATGSESVLRIGNDLNVTADGDLFLSGNVDISGEVRVGGDVLLEGDVKINGVVNIADKVLVDGAGDAWFKGKLTADAIDAVNTLNIAGSAVTSHEVLQFISEIGAVEAEIDFPIQMDHAGEVTFICHHTFYGGFQQGTTMFEPTSATSANSDCTSRPSGSIVTRSGQSAGTGFASAVTRTTMVHVKTNKEGIVVCNIYGGTSNVLNGGLGNAPRKISLYAIALRRYR